MSRTRLTTNDKIKAILEGAVRARFDDDVGDQSTGSRKEMFERGKRMAALYNVNHGSKLVKNRSTKRTHQKNNSTDPNPSARRAREFRTLMDGSQSLSEKDSIDSLSSSLSQSSKNPIDLELRTGSPYRAAVGPKPVTPWYVGYKNSTTGPPSSVFAKASRYGFSGSMSMSMLERPSTVIGPLKNKNPVDEWAPKLEGTPVLWPEDSAHVSGSSVRHRNTHWVSGPRHEKSYTNGTSWDKLNKKNPQRFKALRRAYEREEEEVSRLNESVYSERRHRYKPNASSLSSSSSIGRLGSSLVSPKEGASDRRLKYWSNFTLVYSEDQNPDSVREKLQKEKEDRLLRYQLKWKEMRSLNKVLRASRAPNGEDIDNYNDSLQKTAAENPEPTCLSREQFCKIMLNSMGQHQLINAKHCNRVFSAFDPKRRDRLDIRELIGTLRLMRKPDQPARAKLAELFELFDIEARGYLTLAEIRVIALMGISSDEDKERLVREFNFSFQDYLKKGSDMQDISLADFDTVLTENEPLMELFEEQLQNSLQLQ